jgi:hypothetical protein
MVRSVSRSLVAVGFTCLLALVGACGGTKQEAKAPSTDAADTLRDGSSAPDPQASLTGADMPTPSKADPPKSEPIKTTAVSNTADGSDIVPPFTASASPEPEKKPAKTSKKKGQAKNKKKKSPAS